MLINDFFEIVQLEKTGDNSFEARIQLDSNHKIYEGHFPGNPVVPGICLSQMVKESLEKYKGHQLQMAEAGYLKFMAVVNPIKNPKLSIKATIKSEDNHKIVILSETTDGGTVFFKLKASYTRK